MKKLLIILCLLGAGLKSYAQTNYVAIQDTRAVNNPPTDFKSRLALDFKENSVIGVRDAGYYSAVLTVAPWHDYSGGKNHQLSFNDGGIFYRIGNHSAPTWESWRRLLTEDDNGNVGVGTLDPENVEGWAKVLEVYGTEHSKMLVSSSTVKSGLWSHVSGYYGAPAGGIAGTATNHPFSIMTNKTAKLVVTTGGDVGIGTTDPKGYKLAVNGKIRTQEVKVENANWPDFVFAKDYKLPTLQETEKHIKEKGHLPGIPSAAEVKASGIDLGEMNAKLLQKIEELTLHLIEQNKLLKIQIDKIAVQERKIEKQQLQIDALRL